jgi:hypothetical protein
MGELDAGAKRKENAYREAVAILLSLFPDPDREDGSHFMKDVLNKYHNISMGTVAKVTEMQDEIKGLFRDGSKLSIKWNIKENAIRILEYTDAIQKMNLSRLLITVLLEEGESLGGGYSVSSTVNLEGHRNGLKLNVQSMISTKPGPSGNELSQKNKYIVSEMDGICSELCSEFASYDEFPAGMWMHTREIIYDA